MNKTILKNYAINAREELLNSLSNYKLKEDIACEWFVRIIMLYYLEINKYLDQNIFIDDNNQIIPLTKEYLINKLDILNELLPNTFTKEIEFPICLLNKDSIITKLIELIPCNYWLNNVEIIGWLYQYYNTKLSNAVNKVLKLHAVEKEEVASATQIFTPSWVCKYLVDNSLGRYYLERKKDSNLKLDYLTVSKKGFKIIDENIDLKELTFMDPCMGSGHILVYAFDLYMKIYQENGYSNKDAVKEILKYNLYGLDIDKKVYRICYFALLVKARSYDPDFFNDISIPNIYYPINDLNLENYGSLYINENKVINNVQYYKLLEKKYNVVCTNPPYLSRYNDNLKEYLNNNYADYAKDLFSVYIYKNINFTKENGYAAYMTPFVWMFIKTYEKLREYLITNKSIISLIQMEYSAFKEATVPICAFVVKNAKEEEKGIYIKLSDFKGGMDIQEEKVLEAINNDTNYWYETSEKLYYQIPSKPIAYWVNDKIVNTFIKGIPLDELADARQGIATGDNDIFLRNWYEIDFNRLGLNYKNTNDFINSGYRYAPYNKGGDFRKWYGNNEKVIKFDQESYDLLKKSGNKLPSKQYYFKQSITWSFVSSSYFGVRYSKEGSVFDVGGSSVFTDESLIYYLNGLMSSKISTILMNILNPTINFQVGDIKKIPVIIDNNKKGIIEELVKENIALAKEDWDSFETSWDYKVHPLIKYGTIKDAYLNWEELANNRYYKVKENEELLNKYFMEIYDINFSIVEDNITIRKAELKREIKSLISYIIGCIFGRYSLDKEGLIAKGEVFNISNYLKFKPNIDNLIELNNEIIINKIIEFINICYGKENLNTNLEFIALTLGNSKEFNKVIKNYLNKEFYDDHLRIYKKRPIYWMFSNNEYKSLIYIHRYQKNQLELIVNSEYKHDKKYINKLLKLIKDGIAIDLDLGVKVNYQLFSSVLEKIK